MKIWEKNLAGRPMFIIIAVLANEPNAQIQSRINEQSANQKTKTVRESHRQE